MLLALKPSTATTVALIGACLVLLAFAPPAQAQVDVSDIADTAKDTVDDSVDDVTDTVDETTDQLRRPPGEEGPVGDTVNKVSDTVDEITGGASQPATDELRKIGNETLKPVDDIVGETLGNSDEAPAPGPVDDNTATDSAFVREQQDRREGNSNEVQGTRFQGETVDGSVPSGQVSDEAGVQTQAPERESIAERVGRIATEIAFPLALVIMVAGFLLVQGRLDKKDPKLALAPLDIDEQYLSFR